jgi:hypothetical protein
MRKQKRSSSSCCAFIPWHWQQNKAKPFQVPTTLAFRIMAAAAAAAGAPSAAASTTATRQDPMNALRAATLRRSAPHWSTAAVASSFFSPAFRPRHCRCRCRRAPAPSAAARTPRSRASAKSRAKLLMEAELRDPWLSSLSLLPTDDSASADAASTGWAIGVDPDTGGAVAVLSPDGSSQVQPATLLESGSILCV